MTVPAPAPPRFPAWLTSWQGYLLVGFLAIGWYYLVPILRLPTVLQVVTYSGVTGSGALGVLVGIRRHRPEHGGAWWWLAGGQLAYAVTDALFTVQHLMLGDHSFPGVPDLLHLAEYPLMAVGLALLVRRRTPGWDLASILDAAIIAVGVGLLSWMFLIAPTAGAPGLGLAGRVVSAAYPVGDVLLVCVAARLMLGAAVRATAFRLLSLFLLVLLGTDTLYAAELLLGVYRDCGPLDALWMVSGLMLGAAGLHPSMARLTQPSAAAAPDASGGRIAALAVASLLAPGAELVQYLTGGELYVPVVSGACIVQYLLVLARMAGLVATQRRMATTDGLTGLYSRRYFDQALDTETPRALRSGARLGLLLLDIDHFKSVNDTYGHLGGDRVLVEVARRLRAVTRAGDVLSRYGGEEFALLLPSAGSDELVIVGERLRLAVGGMPVAVDETTSIGVTVSIGAAAIPNHVTGADELILTADQALYAAKAAGRNRLVIASSPGRVLRRAERPRT